jgi:hypothetical protein
VTVDAEGNRVLKDKRGKTVR